MTVFETNFPFEEIRREDDNFFETLAEAKAAGYDDDQIWSLVEADEYIVYGPPHHWINILGFIATKERHDGNTYYEEKIYDENGDLL